MAGNPEIESMPSIDAVKVNSKTPLNTISKDSLNNESKVLEHTTARGNPAPKNFDGSHPVDSLDPSNLNNEKRLGSPQDGHHLLTASSNTVEEGITQETCLKVDESKNTGLNNPEKSSESKPNHQRGETEHHSGEPSENQEVTGHVAEAAGPKEDVTGNVVESSKNKYKESKATASKLTDSGYGSTTGQEDLSSTDESDRSGKDSRESSLDTTGLVNDSGNAALGNLDYQKTESKDSLVNDSEVMEHTLTYSGRPTAGGVMAGNPEVESMPSIDAVKVNSKSPLNTISKDSLNNESKVLEHTVSYRGRATARGVMAGNPAPKNFDGSHPVDSPDPSNLNNEKPFGSPQDLYHLLAGADGSKMPVLTVVHHHHYEKPERQQPPRQTKKVQPTINVYGANSVVIGKHSQAIMADSTMISKSHQPKMGTPTPQETNEDDMTADSEANSTSTTPTTSTGSFNDLSSPKLSNFNFNQEWKTGHPCDQWKKSTQQTGKRKVTDDGSSDEDSSLKDISSVSTHTDTGGGPENCFDISKETNLEGTEDVDQKDRYIQITNESTGDLPSSIDDQSWQSETELMLGPSLSNDLESLLGNEGVQSHQEDSFNSGDFTSRKLAVNSENMVQTETTTLTDEYRDVDRQCGADGHWEIISLQETSLFTSRYINKANCFLRTNAVNMMAQYAKFHKEQQELDNQEDDVD
ncbi:uncharacterized protein LOC117331719 [Pecten maximus]|uniref:uncharacterized protein LOC117331719 n=1 Tax=Pecten maximus TaxID=6579 RepID=UPI001458E10B|nr:uncharacterized protein LOC117331719 [Pecten maximus]